MFNVIYTYESVLPASLGELRHIDLGKFESEDEARDYILSEYDRAIEKYDDEDDADIPTDGLAEYFMKTYTIEAAV